jgi:hypothetical protein
MRGALVFEYCASVLSSLPENQSADRTSDECQRTASCYAAIAIVCTGPAPIFLVHWRLRRHGPSHQPSRSMLWRSGVLFTWAAGSYMDIGGSKRNEAIRHGILVQRRHSRRQKETKSGDAVDRHLRHVHDPRNSFRAAATRHSETSTSRLGEYVSPPRRWEVVKSGDAGSRRSITAVHNPRIDSFRLGTASAPTSGLGEYVALPRRWKKRRLRAPPNTSRITTRSLPRCCLA